MIDLLIKNHINILESGLEQICFNSVRICIDRILNLRRNNGKLFICGNGGSAANAMHIANDFTFGVAPNGNAIRVSALPENSSILTCLGNDIGYDNIFSHQLKVQADEGDCLMVLSGSGNSDNIIKAMNQAKNIGMDTIAILGYDGGKAKGLADICFHFENEDMQVSEDLQLILGHILMKALYEKIKT